MKNKAILILTVLITSMCSTQKKVYYELPAEMLPHVKVVYEDRCAKGQRLWEASCEKCHTKKVHGKKIIPDFSSGQLSGYTLRVANKKHESNLPDSLVSEEDLGLIMTFLTYKKKNK